MKSFKGSLIFAVVVAAIGGFAFFEYKKANQEKEAERTARHLIRNLQVTDVAEVRHSSETINYTVKAEGAKWVLAIPFEDTADTEAVEALIRGIAVSDVEEVSAESIDWTKYGLDKPSSEMFIKYKSGKEEKVAIGRVRSFDQGFYLRLNDGKNLLVAQLAFDSFVTKSAKDLRSRKLQLPTGAWAKVQVNSKKKERLANFSFAFADAKWQSPRQKNMRLNETAIMEFRRSLEDVKGEEIVADENSEKKRKEFGLHKADLIIDLESVPSADAKVVDKVQILVSAVKDDNVFFTTNLNKAIYKTAARNVEALFKVEDDFRNRKYPFEFEQAKVAKVKIVDASGKLTRSVHKDGISWVTDIPLESGKVLKQAAVEDLIKAVADLDIRDFSSREGGGTLKAEIALLDAADQPVIKLNYGRPYKVKDNEFYLVKASTSDDTFGVGRATLDDLSKRELVEAAPAPAAAPSASPAEDTKK